MSLERLTAELGADPPAAVAALTDADLQVLADALAAARRDQAAALAEATERGLAFIPRVLRGPVTRALFR